MVKLRWGSLAPTPLRQAARHTPAYAVRGAQRDGDACIRATGSLHCGQAAAQAGQGCWKKFGQTRVEVCRSPSAIPAFECHSRSIIWKARLTEYGKLFADQQIQTVQAFFTALSACDQQDLAVTSLMILTNPAHGLSFPFW